MKRISEILAGLPVKILQGNPARLVNAIQYDSRKVGSQDVFVAIRGFRHDGHDYITQAYQKGCRVFVVEEMPAVEDDEVVIVQVEDTRRWLPFMARNFYENAVAKLKIVGVTGTYGKTTVAYLLKAILEAAHWKPGLISSAETIIGKERFSLERTTPESLDLYRLLYEMHRQHLKSAVVEVSSHALALHRTAGIPFLAAVFTNLGPLHLNFHQTQEKYFLAKKRLFDGLGQNDRAVVNADDVYSERILADTAGDVFTFSQRDPRATVYLKSSQLLSDGMSVRLQVPSGELFFTTSLVGKFNVENLLAAVTTAISLGLQEEFIVSGIESLRRIPGHCEKYLAPAGFRVFIDYANSSDALQRTAEALLEFHPSRLTVVFGCKGNSARKQRSQMGKVAEDYADQIILTSDNPRSEDPLKIIEEIKAGIYDQSKVTAIPDRRSAIETALSRAQKNEIVLIAGKGHETYQEFSGGREPFEDHAVVENFLSP